MDNKRKNRQMCSIYKTKTQYKIITIYSTDVGIYVANTPVFILEITTDMEKINEAIWTCLNASKKMNYKEYQRESINYLKLLKEPSLKKLYNNSKNCKLYIQDKKANIVPYKKSSDKGLEEVEKDTVVMDYSPEKELEITEKAIELLNKSYK